MKRITLNAQIIMLFSLFLLSNGNSQARQVSKIPYSSHPDGYQRSNIDVLGFHGLDGVLGINWLELPSLNVSRGNFVSVGTNDHIYSLGGVNIQNNKLKSVELASINSDGSLESWQYATPMIIQREDLAAVIAGDHLYAFGGSELNSVEFADINSDGSLGNWETTSSMIKSRSTINAVTNGIRIYILGGFDYPSLNTASIEFAAINHDGSVTSWQLTSSMKSAREYTTAVILGDNIYVIGGVGYPFECLKTVEKATINEDGTLSDWEYTTSLNQCRYQFASIVINRYIYAIGGNGSTGKSNDTIERARINPDGTLSNWEVILTMSTPRACNTAVANDINRHIYVIGGEGSCNGKSVEAIPFDAPVTYGLTINHGALFTNQISVTLSIDAPYTTVQMQVSNDGGFAGAQWEAYVDRKDWTITQYGSYVIPRVVYVRFKDINGNLSTTYQDDIILDVTAPTGSVEATQGVSQNSLEAVDKETLTHQSTNPRVTDFIPVRAYLPFMLQPSQCPPLKPANITLHLTAQDDLSGVADMMICNQASFYCSEWEPYATTREWYVPKGTTTVYVKFRDQAGNVSKVATDTIKIH